MATGFLNDYTHQRMTQTTISKAYETLEATGDFKIIRRLRDPEVDASYLEKNKECREDIVTALIVDCEATSSDPGAARPIELAMVIVAFRASNPELGFTVVEAVTMLNDPGIPSEPGAQAVHGIPAEALVGHSLDMVKIDEILAAVDFVIAHNAAYDRPVISRAAPAFEMMKWVCSMKDIPWQQMGISSRSLEHLLYKAGYFHDGHRALADCFALLAVITHKFLDGDQPILELSKVSKQSNWSILCDNAPYETKDAMRSRGYRWNPGTEGIPYKVWSSPELKDKVELLAELEWIKSNVFSDNAETFVTSIPVSALTRYASNQTTLAFRNKSSFRLGQTIAKLQTETATLAPV